MFSNTSISPLVVEILSKRVSFQNNTWSAFSKEMSIEEVLKEIQSDKHKYQVQNLRSLLQNNKKDEYNSHKRTLPAVTICGTFDSKRQKSKIKTYNSVIILDVDKLDTKQLARVKQCFQNDPFVFSFWESPSKEGVKGLVSLHYKFDFSNENLDRAHKGAFQKLANYFKEQHHIELDKSGSDTTRLCFFSYDPLIVIKENAVLFEIVEIDILPVAESKERVKHLELTFASNKDALYNPENRNAPGDRYIISAILRFLEKNKLSITNSYEEWYKVGMAIANTFTYDVGMKYFLKLSSLDKTKYIETECKNFLVNCYETRSGALKFSTIVYFANQKGYITRKQRERGSEAVDESLSQVSSSKTVVHLPEDLKR